jgi:hypothetical protein
VPVVGGFSVEGQLQGIVGGAFHWFVGELGRSICQPLKRISGVVPVGRLLQQGQPGLGVWVCWDGRKVGRNVLGASALPCGGG